MPQEEGKRALNYRRAKAESGLDLRAYDHTGVPETDTGIVKTSIAFDADHARNVIVQRALKRLSDTEHALTAARSIARGSPPHPSGPAANAVHLHTRGDAIAPPVA